MGLMEINMLGRVGMMVPQSGPAQKLNLYDARTAMQAVAQATPDTGMQPVRDLSFANSGLDTKLNLGQGEIIDVRA